MSVTFNMLAPSANATFIAQDGTSYTSNANAVITGVTPGDIGNLINSGCILYNQRATVTYSTSSAQYITQGANNIIPTSTADPLYTLAAPAYIGQTTTIIGQSTTAFTVTASGATIYNSTNAACTVLTQNNKGVVNLIATGSTSYQILDRTIATSSAGVVYCIASS